MIVVLAVPVQLAAVKALAPAVAVVSIAVVSIVRIVIVYLVMFDVYVPDLLSKLHSPVQPYCTSNST
jgi:hypothetical protein